MPLPPISAPLACQIQPAEYAALLDRAVGLIRENTREFRVVSGEAMEELPCLSGALTPQQAATLHYVLGLHNALTSDREPARRAFCAAFVVNPDLTPSSEVLDVPDYDSVIAEGRVCAHGAVGRTPLEVPAGAHVLVDGVPSATRPVDRPYLVQVVWDADESVHWTGYIGSEAYDLSLGIFAPPDPPVRLVPTWQPLAAVGTTAGAGLLYALAWRANYNYQAPDTLDAAADQWEQQNTAFTFASLGVGAVALGLDTWLVARVVGQHRDEAARRKTRAVPSAAGGAPSP